MMNFNVRAKSVLLAFAMIASTSNNFCGEKATTNVLTPVGTYIATHKGAIVGISAITTLVILYDWLKTQQRVHYNYDNWMEDIKNLLKSYNVFDPESRAVIKHFIKKYLVGAELKLDEVTTRTKEADGTVVTLRRKKLTQRPSGFMGLLDAYVFQQAQKITDVMPAMVGLCALIICPQLIASKALKDVLPKEETPKGASLTVTFPGITPEALQGLLQAMPQSNNTTES